jgi:hypothetical protein
MENQSDSDEREREREREVTELTTERGAVSLKERLMEALALSKSVLMQRRK